MASVRDDNSSLLLWSDFMDSPPRLFDQNMQMLEEFRYPWAAEHGRAWNIFPSCNGLICLQRPDVPTLYVWNPVLGEARELPHIFGDDWGDCVPGFGFCSSANDYKMVVFYMQTGQGARRECVQVYSMNTGSWRELEFPFPAIGERLFHEVSDSVSNDGTIFWLSSTSLVSFDIATERFSAIQVQTEPGNHPYRVRVFEKFLAISYQPDTENGHGSVRMWLIEKAGMNLNFTPKNRIDLGSGEFLCIWKNELVFLHRDVSVPNEGNGRRRCRFRMYSFESGQERWLDSPENSGLWEAFPFERSSVSVIV